MAMAVDFDPLFFLLFVLSLCVWKNALDEIDLLQSTKAVCGFRTSGNGECPVNRRNQSALLLESRALHAPADCRSVNAATALPLAK
eukprot:scaffold1892_cov47-Attheya_sp.AAC.1